MNEGRVATIQRLRDNNGRFGFGLRCGRWEVRGWWLCDWHWRVRFARSYRDRVIVGLDVCLGRYTVVAKRGKPQP